MDHARDHGPDPDPSHGVTLAAWPSTQRAQRAILVVDIVGPAGSVDPAALRSLVDTHLPVAAIGRHQVGNSLLLEFDQVAPAVECALRLSRHFSPPATAPGQAGVRRLRIAGRLADAVDAALGDARPADPSLAAWAQALDSAATAGQHWADSDFIVSSEFADRVTPMLDGDLQDLGDVMLAGDDAPQRAFRIAQAQPLLRAPTDGQADRAGIVVVPFVARQPGSDGDVLGQVLADDLIAAFGPVAGLRVISRLSSQWFARRTDSERRMARLLGVQYQLRGSYIVRGGELRVFANLVDLRNAEVLWTDRFDVALADVLAGGDAASARIVPPVCRVLMQRETERAQGTPLESLESFSILFGAIGLMHRLQRPDFERAGAMLRHLVARHPRAATPRAWLGQWHVLRVAQGWSANPAADAAEAGAVLATALDLEPQHALALAVDGLLCAYVRRDLDLAGQRYAAALRANPNEGLALLFRAVWHAYRDEGAAAVRCAFDAQDLSPLDPLRYFYDNFTSTALLATDDYHGAIEYGRRSMRANRSHGPTLRVLAIALALDGRMDEARGVATELLRLEPGFTARQFADRYPGVATRRTERYADALRQAGVPP